MKKAKKENDASRKSVTFARAGKHERSEKLLRNASGKKVAADKERVSADLTRRARRPDLRERFQRFMTATAFAESGETGTAMEIAYPHEQTTKVLLAVGAIDGSDLNEDVFRYAVSLCRRMDASLEVLRVVRQRPADTEESLRISSARRSEEIKKLLRQVSVNRLPVHVSVTVGELDKEVYAYAKDNKDVVAVVFESPHVHKAVPERGKWQRTLRVLSRRLAIPMIIAESKGPVESLRKA